MHFSGAEFIIILYYWISHVSHWFTAFPL